jgi:hypothetical protein
LLPPDGFRSLLVAPDVVRSLVFVDDGRALLLDDGRSSRRSSFWLPVCLLSFGDGRLRSGRGGSSRRLPVVDDGLAAGALVSLAAYDTTVKTDQQRVKWEE